MRKVPLLVQVPLWQTHEPCSGRVSPQLRSTMTTSGGDGTIIKLGDLVFGDGTASGEGGMWGEGASEGDFVGLGERVGLGVFLGEGALIGDGTFRGDGIN